MSVKLRDVPRLLRVVKLHQKNNKAQRNEVEKNISLRTSFRGYIS